MRRLGFAVLMLFAAPVAAEDMRVDMSPAELKTQLESWGYKVFAHEDEEDRPQLLVSSPTDQGVEERKGFAMRMSGCAPEDAMFMQKRCDGFEFRAYIKPGFPIKDKVYADWNRDLGRTRAFVEDDVPRLAWFVNVKNGVSWANIRASVDIWRKDLAAYIEHLDASVMD
ncbi:hypothetical protein [Magnetovibrio sp.]|uniref:hypothetical protein n=1 Tax=Magnetovibrio sp. TaxID=2024836 RepID=UPI002F9476BF